MITDLGYKRRTYEEILNAKIAKAKELFGEDINTENNTALGKYIRINAYDQYYVEQLAEKIYYSIFPQYSSGQSLDRLGWSVGMTRNMATPSRYLVHIVGTAGEKVEYGFLVGTESELNFFNTEETTIGEDGTCDIIVECVESGTMGNVSPDAINNAVNPVASVESVKGISIVETATDDESDYDFIKRYEIVREGKGSCTVASIISALTNIPTVHGAYVRVNESATETVDDIPPKTIACYVDGGESREQEIAEAIFDKKPIGIGTHGNKSVPVSYGSLKDYIVKFSYARNVNVRIKIVLVTNDEFETNGNNTIKNNIETFINALGIGNPLYVTTLYGQIYTVAGVISAQIQVSTDGEEFSTSDITVQPYECCVLSELSINDVIV